MSKTLNKQKIKTVVANVREEVEYSAETKCPYCKAYNNCQVEEDNITITETCWNCGFTRLKNKT